MEKKTKRKAKNLFERERVLIGQIIAQYIEEKNISHGDLKKAVNASGVMIKKILDGKSNSSIKLYEAILKELRLKIVIKL